MAQTATTARFKNNNEQFPILFEDDHVRVYKNPANEIFVENIQSGVTIRINSYPYLDGGLQFTTGGLLEPFWTNGMIGWRIRPR